VEVLFLLLSNYLHPKSPKIHAQTNNGVFDGTHKWSPDGTKIAFTRVIGDADRDGNFDIYVMNADGSNPRRLTTDPASHDNDPSWSPDGTKIAFLCDKGAMKSVL
jgi:Tol biopolymer transport system component